MTKKSSPPRARNFNIILYPDTLSYDCDFVLEKAKLLYHTWAYILHDRDMYADGERAGELKKPHYHFVVHFENGRSIQSVAKDLGIPENYIEFSNTFEHAVHYLTHDESERKTKYDRDEIVVSPSVDLEKVLDYQQLSESEQVKRILDYIYSARPDYPELTSWVLERDYWAAYRRSFTVIDKVIGSLRMRAMLASSR